jgi:hypothetical protein
MDQKINAQIDLRGKLRALAMEAHPNYFGASPMLRGIHGDTGSTAFDEPRRAVRDERLAYLCTQTKATRNHRLGDKTGFHSVESQLVICLTFATWNALQKGSSLSLPSVSEITKVLAASNPASFDAVRKTVNRVLARMVDLGQLSQVTMSGNDDRGYRHRLLCNSVLLRRESYLREMIHSAETAGYAQAYGLRSAPDRRRDHVDYLNWPEAMIDLVADQQHLCEADHFPSAPARGKSSGEELSLNNAA